MAKATASTGDATIIDGASLFGTTEAIAKRFDRSRVTIDYSVLHSCLDTVRKTAGWRPATSNTILLSIDPNSEAQQRFLTMLNHTGFSVDEVHYRDAFASLPPGQSPTNDSSFKSPVSLSARIAYIAGVISRQFDAHFLVVSHEFELFGPLVDLAKRLRTGKVGVAYFRSLLDFRWTSAGLFDGKLGIEAFDLDEYSPQILGVDVLAKDPPGKERKSALGQF